MQLFWNYEAMKIVCPIEITLFDNICILYQKQQNVDKTLCNIAINTGATKVQQFAPFFAQNQLESRFKLVSDLIKDCF